MAARAGANYTGTREQGSRNNHERLANGLGWFSIGLGLAEVAVPGTVAKLIGLEDDDRRRSVLRVYGLREIAAGIGILAQPKPAGWLWARVAGDVLDLASLGSAMASSDADRTKLGAATAAVIGVTALDVICAKQLSSESNSAEPTNSGSRQIIKTIIVNRSPEEVYRFWRDFSNFPSFMQHVESVQVTGNTRSHWTVDAPAGRTVEWDAEIVDDQPNSLIAWRSLEGADIDNSGSVRFEKAPGNRGTLVRVELQYAPPAGAIGATIAKLFRSEPAQQIDDDLRRLKQILETGEIAKSDASIHPGMHPAQPSAKATARAASA